MTGRVDRPRGRAVAALTGAAVGTTAWMSLGVVAAIDPARGTRLVALPPWPWLMALIAVGAAVAAVVRLPKAAAAPIALLALPWLPLLPWRVPPAFLIWDGPLEGALWIAALSGAGATWWGTRPRADGGAPAAEGTQAWLAGLLAVAIALAAWTGARPRVPAGDEPHYLVITQSLLRDRDLRIEDNHRDEQYLAYFDGALRPDFMRRGVDRQIYSIHAPGTAVVVLPAFAAAGYAGAVVTVAILAGLGATALWRAARLLSGSASGAWAAVSALVTASPYVLLSFTIYPDPIGSAIVAAGLWALVRLDAGAGLPARGWVAIGAALAALPWLHTRFAVLAGGFGAVLALRALQGAGGRRDAARLLAVPALSAAAWFGYFQAIYGTPDPRAPYGAGSGAGLSYVATGLAGLLVDQQFGLFANAPALVAGLAGAVWLARDRPRLAAELAVGAVPYLITAASFPMWWGGYSSPARFAVVITPVVALPIALLWRRTARVGRGAIIAALAVSAAITVTVVGVDRGAFVYNGRDGHALLLDWLSPAVDLTLAAPSVHRDGPAAAALDALVWLGAGAGTIALAARVARTATVVAWLGAPIVLMAAASVVWAGRDRPLVSVPTSSLRYLAACRDGRLPVAAQLSPVRRLTGADGVGRLRLGGSTRGAAEEVPPLLRVPNVPAGDYDVFVDAAGEPEGMATVLVGRQGGQDLPVEQWRFDGRRTGYGGLALHLPVDVDSVTVQGDQAARRSVRSLSLRPRELAPPERFTALRAARYGRVVVYALDDSAYLEPGAFWTRGERSAGLVVQRDPEAPAVVMRVTAGPVATHVRVAAGAWQRELALAADASVDVPVPAEALAPAVLTIATDTGFRPSAFGRRGDVRWLGVYVTWPEGAATKAP